MGLDKKPARTNLFFEKLDRFMIHFDLGSEEKSKRMLTALAGVCTIPFIFLFAGIQFSAKEYTLGAFLLFLGIICTISLIFGRYAFRIIPLYRFIIIALGLLFLYMIGTSQNYPNRLLWSFIFPMEAYFMLGRKEGALYNFLFLASVGVLLFSPELFHAHVYPDIIMKMEFLISLFLVCVISYAFESIKTEYHKGISSRQADLEEEKGKLSEANKRLEQAEKELSLINNELEQRIQQRAMELTEVNEQLKESERKYKALFQDSLEAMSLTQNGRIVDVNPAWLKLHGYRHTGDIIGMDIIHFIHPDHHSYIRERRKKKHLDLKNPIIQHKDLQADGTSIDVEVHTSTIEIEGRTLRLTTVRDITEKKRAEKLKRELEEKLRRAEKMEAIGILAGGVAHDLNNILSGLVGYPDLLLMDLPEDSPLRSSVLAIQKSGQKAATIVQDLLTLARRGVENKKILDLNKIVSETVTSPEIEKIKAFHPNVVIKTRMDKALLNIHGSSIHITKALMNLISNAAEAMPDGGVLRIQTENRYVDKPITGYDHVEEGDYVVLIVSDDGIGISSDDLKNIFEPFFTKKVMGRSGTGLGMTVVWGTVKDHQGYIDVESVEGGGSTFTLYFPATTEEISEDTLKRTMKDYMGRGESILIVDDVEEQREIANTILTRLGYSVHCASGGLEAIDYIKDHPVDIVILDMIMDPGIDGLDTYKLILEIYPNQKAIIASGYSETERVKEAMSIGAAQYIRKPYTLEKIGIAVREELDRP
ncbi:MAG: PAS domain S-box protein [Deltaproteobacteria bacterium]|nr:PAS domain S-box protein [Deltaproteobacteria bacterium]